MQQIDVIIKRHKWGWIGRKDESSVARQAMQCNPQDGIGRKKGRTCVTWRRGKGEQESNNWLSQEFGGELALLRPYVSVEIKETKKMNNIAGIIYV